MMGKIILEKNLYAFEEIKSGKWNEQDEYLNSSLRFCQEWLNGKSSFILNTSGSTGIPKQISVFRNQMAASAMATKDFFNIQDSDRLLCCLNTDLIAGKMMLVRALEWDCELVLIKPSQNPLLNDWIDMQIDFAAMVPLQVEACMSDEKSLSRIKNIPHLIIGGAAVSASLSEKIIKEKLNAFQTYGMTETVSHIALAKIQTENLIYKALPAVKIGVNENHQLWIEAPMAGPGRIQTNDVIELLDEASFIWIGRSDFTINSGGVKIQPEPVEKMLVGIIRQNLGDIRYFVGSKPDSSLGEKVVLFLETDDCTEQTAKLLLIQAKEILPKFHRPREVVWSKKFIETDSGKINRPATIASL